MTLNVGREVRPMISSSRKKHCLGIVSIRSGIVTVGPTSNRTISIDFGFMKSTRDKAVSEAGTINVRRSLVVGGFVGRDESMLIEVNDRL
jgi:hypothetical protein